MSLQSNKAPRKCTCGFIYCPGEWAEVGQHCQESSTSWQRSSVRTEPHCRQALPSSKPHPGSRWLPAVGSALTHPARRGDLPVAVPSTSSSTLTSRGPTERYRATNPSNTCTVPQQQQAQGNQVQAQAGHTFDSTDSAAGGDRLAVGWRVLSWG